jgi:succinate dehydrogenase / fumarate reductase membrane anchor subunit
MSGVGRARPESGIELYAWLFMRVSGVVLLFMALGHLAIMHVINNVEIIDYQFVARRYMTPFWRTYDLVMLWLALIHGLNGVRILVEDYVGARGWRVVTLASLYVVGFVFLVLGSLVILTFQPVASH